MLPRIEVGELRHPVQHVGDELAQEDAWRDPDLPAQLARYGPARSVT